MAWREPQGNFVRKHAQQPARFLGRHNSSSDKYSYIFNHNRALHDVANSARDPPRGPGRVFGNVRDKHSEEARCRSAHRAHRIGYREMVMYRGFIRA
jgi:hypothetical protein